MVGGVVAAAALGGIALLPKQEAERRLGSAYPGSTVVAVELAFCFYPLTLMSLGNDTNGGWLGLASLLLATIVAWRAFICNRINPWLRRLVQMPLTSVVTYMLIREVVVQCRHWLRL